MPANSARLMVCEGGIEVTIILMRVSEAGWVVAALREEEPLFLEPSVYTKSCLFQARVLWWVSMVVACVHGGGR
jgi:hypothetical protein